MEQTRVVMSKVTDLNLEDRDPNSINEHIRVAFEDVIAEPEGAHSFGCVWTSSAACFNCWKLCTYRCLTLFYGICIAAEWGYYFALTAFYHIWIITPTLKVLEINCAVLKKLYGLCVHCCIDPCCEAFGSIFWAFQKK